MKIATIPFLNAAPYYSPLDAVFLSKHHLISDSPRDLGLQARQGSVDAGLLSLVDFWNLEKDALFESLGSFGVAGKGEILSILLFGVHDPAQLEGKRIAVSGQTSTSVKLMALWLKEKIKIKHWTAVELGSPADAALLIADQALARRLSAAAADPAPIDLCEQWTHWTSLPFVFARWAVRSELPESDRQDLLKALDQALKKSEDNWPALAQELALSSGFPAAFIEKYLRGICYRLGTQEEAGMQEFKQRLKKAKL